MKNIEVEVRSFISIEQYHKLLEFFKANSNHAKDDYQETYYFRSIDSDADLRIQRSSAKAKLWLKKGKLHDFCREEIEIPVQREDFEKLEKLLNALGFSVKIKWFRQRSQFDWNGIKICLDFTKGYGHIIELEKLCSESEAEQSLSELKTKMAELGIAITPKEVFDKKFRYYEENWKELTGEK